MFKTALIALVVAASGSMANPLPAPAAPLMPVGKWRVEYSDNMCVLSHDYGSGDGVTTVGFRPLPFSTKLEFVLITNRTPAARTNGLGSVMLGGINRRTESTYYAWSAPGAVKRVTTFSVDQRDIPDLADATTVTLASKDGPSVSIAPKALRPAFAALKTCQDDLIRGWGLDPSEAEQIAKPASDDSPAWITTDDYPSEALRSEAAGAVMFLWKIDIDGRAKDCKVLATSGNSYLDAAPCRLWAQRARYTPATGLDGKLMASHRTLSIVWNLPQ